MTNVNLSVEEPDSSSPVVVAIDGLTLHADRYLALPEEDDAPAVVQLMFNVSEAEHEALSDLVERHYVDEEYFPVVLEGPHADPTSMRFGSCLWQRSGTGFREHIVLISEAGDRPELARTHDDVSERLTDAVVAQDVKLDALIAELRRAGLLSDDAIDRIEDAASTPAPRSRYRQFRRRNYLENALPPEWA